MKKTDYVLACGHAEYRDSHCAEMTCPNYVNKFDGAHSLQQPKSLSVDNTSEREATMIPETCKFYVSIEQPECGREAVGSITTHITHRDQARVPLCDRHKRQYNQQMARLRAESKQVASGS